MTGAEQRVRAADLTAALRVRYAAPEWMTAFEVTDRAGGAGRRADCVAMNCFESRGLELHGVEIKVNRNDWLRELKNPAKAEEGAYRYCDRWWIAAPKGVVHDAELPPGWGLLELTGGKLRARVKAAPRTPQPLDRAFMASFVRKLGKPGEEEMRVLLLREARRVEKLAETQRATDEHRYEQMLAEMSANSARLQELFGLNLRWFHEPEAAEVAQFVQAARTLGSEGRRAYLVAARQKVQDALAQLDAAIATPLTPEVPHDE